MSLPCEWFSAMEIAGLPGVPTTPQGVNKSFRDLPANIRRKRKGRGACWEIHISALPTKTQATLLLKEKSQSVDLNEKDDAYGSQKRQTLWAYYEAKPQKAKDEAEKRFDILQAVEVMTNNGVKLGEAIASLAKHSNVSISSIRGWRKLVNGSDKYDWLAILVPKHAGRQQEAMCTSEAWEVFKADYLRLEAPAAQACYERLQRTAKQENWKVPSLKTLLRKIEKEIPRPVLILAREGKEALGRSFPSQERDHSFYHALEAVNADGHKFDVFVRFPDGEVCRPLMVAWQDIFAAKILSYRIEKTENSDSVRLSFGDMAKRYGIPRHAYLDNGRGFASKWITGGIANRYRFKVKEEDPAGILTKMGVEVHWATPYHGQAKPIERAFRDLCEYVAKHPAFEGAYTGNSPSAKPENYGDRSIPLHVFKEILDQEITAHNARKGRRSAVCAGSRSFDEVFNESYSKSIIRKASEEQLRFCLLAAEKVTSSKQDGSITLLGNRYYTDILAVHAGKKVVARFDPQNLHNGIHVYLLDGRYICQAECTQKAGFGDTQAAREHNKIRNQYKKAAKQQLKREVSLTALEVSAMIPQLDTEEETPVSKVVKAMFETKKPKEDIDDVEGAFGIGVQRLFQATR